MADSLSINDLKEVFEELYDARTKWQNIGLGLNMKPTDLEAIGMKHKNDPGECFRELLSTWLKQANPMWATLVEALKSPTVGFEQLSETVQEKHLSRASASKESLECTDTPQVECTYSSQPQSTNSSRPESVDSPQPKPEIEQFRCPCGSCDLLTYLDKGCPKTNSESCSYPYLQISTLSKNDREDLIQKLSHDNAQIIKCFANLLSSTSESLKKRQIPVTQLVKVSLDYGAYESATNEVPLLKEDESKLEQATLIDGVFIILRKHMSFFNHGILQHIIEHLGDENDRSKFSDFYCRFTVYCERRVFKAPPTMFCPSGSEKSGRKQFVVLASHYLIKTLADVNSARSKIATLLGLAVSTVRLEKIDIGSVILVFSIPGMLNNVFPLKPATHAKLKACGFTLIVPDMPTSQSPSTLSQDLGSLKPKSHQIFEPTVMDSKSDSQRSSEAEKRNQEVLRSIKMDESTTPEEESEISLPNIEIQSDSVDSHLRKQSITESHVGRPTATTLRIYVREHVLDKWEELADELGLDDEEEVSEKLEKLKMKCGKDKKKATFEVLKLWLNHYKTKATWEKLIEALTRIKLNDALNSVRKYLSGAREDETHAVPMETDCSVPSSQAGSSGGASVSQQSQENQQVLELAADLHQVTERHFEVKMKPGQTVRNYQHELASPGINGENYIMFAPTNSGKTLVAALVIAKHLEKNPGKRANPKVVMVVKTRILADQQTKNLQEYIPTARVECSRGTELESLESKQPLQSVGDALARSDIIVCTAGKLVDGIKKRKVTMGDISLLILDECHNTEKGTNYAQIMQAYLELKVGGGSETLPQVVGLTATPGVGKNPGLDQGKEIDKLLTLCAHMDATSGIKPVQETDNIKELKAIVPKPDYQNELVKQSEQRQVFIHRIEKEMKKCEDFIGFKFEGDSPRWSQHYEQEVKKMKASLEGSDNPGDKHKISSVRVLECLTKTLVSFIDLPYALATTPLEEYDELNIPDQKLSDHDKQLKDMLKKLKSDLSKLPICENPILEKVQDKLVKTFKQNSKSEGIVFVRTREQAKAISEWISGSEFAKEIRVTPHMLLGHKQKEDKGPRMSDGEQKAIVEGFRSGDYNLLIATSVAEEGLDIQQCNLVMRLHISSAKSKAQMQGRARAEDSEIVTIVSDDPKKLYKDILNDELLLLTERTVQDILSRFGAGFFNTMMPGKQQEIVENMKRQREDEKLRASTHPAHAVELKCKKCKVLACRGSDLYFIDHTYNCVVPGDVLAYETTDHNEPRILCSFDNDEIDKLHKIHCTNSNCNTRWGVLGTWRKSGKEFPVLKCDNFNFYKDGIQFSFKGWKRCAFKILPLSTWFAQNKS